MAHRGVEWWQFSHLYRTSKLAKPNYQFVKRQKELAKKKNQEEKQRRKASKNQTDTADGVSPPVEETQK